MKLLLLYSLSIFALVSGCKYSTGPSEPNHVVLLSGFSRGVDTLSAFGLNDIRYNTRYFKIASYDTIEISFNYSHSGIDPAFFYLGFTSPYEFNYIWDDRLLTGGECENRIDVSVAWLGSPDSINLYFATNHFGLPSAQVNDSVYFYDLKVTGFRRTIKLE